MKVTIEVKLKPFQVPNFVLADEGPRPKQDGFVEGKSYSLSDLDAVTLRKMCDEFTAAVFKKAGKSQPSTAVRSEDND